jgi:hypothetical protein
MPSASKSRYISAIMRVVSALMGSSFSTARRMILSSMSVMLRTKVTRRPEALSQRCTTSNTTLARAWPMWHRS